MLLMLACDVTTPQKEAEPQAEDTSVDSALDTGDTDSTVEDSETVVPPVFDVAPVGFSAVSSVRGDFGADCSGTYEISGIATTPCDACLFTFEVTSVATQYDGLGCAEWFVTWGAGEFEDVTFEYLPLYEHTYRYHYEDPQFFRLWGGTPDITLDVYGTRTPDPWFTPDLHTYETQWSTRRITFDATGFTVEPIPAGTRFRSLERRLLWCSETLAPLPTSDTLATTVAEGTTRGSRGEAYALDLVAGDTVHLSLDGASTLWVARPDGCLAGEGEPAAACTSGTCPASSFTANADGTWYVVAYSDDSVDYALGVEVNGVAYAIGERELLDYEEFDIDNTSEIVGTWTF